MLISKEKTNVDSQGQFTSPDAEVVHTILRAIPS